MPDVGVCPVVLTPARVGVSQVLAQLPDVGVSPAVLTPARVGVSQ